MTTKEATRSFELQLEIKSPVDAVWKALTEAEELTRWFPLEARVKPGAGGSIWISWGAPWAGDGPIEIWEPNRRLKMAWQMSAEGPAGAAAPLSVDYQLEARGGSTVLHLIHSGFGKGTEWDGQYDGVTRGWAFELRGLRHYLEHHRGNPRRVIWLRRGTALLPLKAMPLLIGPEGRLFRGNIEGLAEGDRYRLDLVGMNHQIEGIVATNIPPRSFSGTVSSMNNAFFRCEMESCGGDGKEEVWVWFSTYGVPAGECDKIERYVRSALDRTLIGN